MVKEKTYWTIEANENLIDDRIVWLEKQPNGYVYANLYLKLLLLQNMRVHIFPMSYDDISIITRTDIDTVIVAMSILNYMGMVKKYENDIRTRDFISLKTKNTQK